MKQTILTLLLLASCVGAAAQEADSARRQSLGEVQVSARRSDGVSRLGGAENGTHIGQDELFRAACCNLGESFVNNPSVDVNYSDAATGARQIRLLGLSGEYVQMLTEGMPMPTGSSMPFNLGFVPGAWMQSISVSKGAASVKNGYQSLTGQINVEYTKPDDEPGLVVNLYADRMLKAEGNAVGNFKLTPHLSTALFAHYEHDFGHDDMNDDGWLDLPAVRQLNVSNRWKYARGRYIFHGGVTLLRDRREGGTADHFAFSGTPAPGLDQFPISVGTDRAEAYMKHAYLIDRDHNTNLALLVNAATTGFTMHNVLRSYDDDQRHLNAQLILEHDFNDVHSLSTGLSLGGEWHNPTGGAYSPEDEVVPGAYAQYTFKPSYRLTVMGGLRVDHSSLYGRTFATPRMHVKWTPLDWLSLRASAGKGYRTPHPWAEHANLLGTGRALRVDTLGMEEAWNTGLSAALTIPLGDRYLKVNAEYYYTRFVNQAVVDFDSDPSLLWIHDLDGRSYSHTLQVDANCKLRDDLDLTAAFRLNDVRCTYGGQLLEKPFASRFKALVTASWTPMMELWQVDLTLCLNGPGRLPQHPALDSDRFPAYPTLNAQVTRRFRHLSVYVGGENLTNYTMSDPVLNPSDPTSPLFEPNFVWGPLRGAMVYAGVRLNFWKL